MVYNIFGYVSEEVCIFVDLSKIHVEFIHEGCLDKRSSILIKRFIH